ncbi:MAG: MBL fold metallo-hydrolase, partial [Spirochaetaceae bacterium]|nr:MBL fold metallo-hydrolase [Spirochaetaceae bacterium]
MEVRADDTVCCVDFGTGVRAFGEYLQEHDIPCGLKTINFFVTHSHWDHIIGFPMFSPVYLPRIKMNIYAPYMINGVSMEDLIKTELSYEYWPVG